MNKLLPLLLAVAFAATAAPVPAGSLLEVRIRQGIASYSSHTGDEVQADIIAPVQANGQTLLPQGAVLRGQLEDVKAIRSGLRNLRASLRVRFDRLQLPDGEMLPVRARVISIDNARETVDETGKIVGIRATAPMGHRLAGVTRNVFIWDPLLQFVLAASTAAMLRFPEAEIHFPAGTEMVVKLDDGIELDRDWSTPLPHITANLAEEERLRDIVRGMTYRTKTEKSLRDADLVNVVLLGEPEWIQRAFAAAGWLTVDRLSKRAGWMTFRSVAEAKAYPRAPMSAMTLDEKPAMFQFAKALNSYSKRHHIRIFGQSQQWNGRPVQAAATTQDIAITWSFRNNRLIHVIDRNIDNERAKIVNDLIYTGCVDAGQLIARPWVPESATVSTGETVLTDSAVAVLELNPCRTPLRTVEPDDGRRITGGRGEHITRQVMLTLGNDFTFNNPIYQAGKGLQFLWRRMTGREARTAHRRVAAIDPPRTVDLASERSKNGLP